MKTRSQTSGSLEKRSTSRADSRTMEDDRLKLEAKRNKALKSKAARQREKDYREKLLLELKQTGEEIQNLVTEKRRRQQKIELLESQLKLIEMKLYVRETSSESDQHGSSTREFAFSPAPREPFAPEYQQFPQDMLAAEELEIPGITFGDESSAYSSAIEHPPFAPAPTFLSEDAHSWSSISEVPAQSFTDASLGIPSDLDISSVSENLDAGSLQGNLFVESSHDLCRPSTSSSSTDISFEASSATYTAEGCHLESQSPKKTSKKSRIKDKQYTYLQSPRKDPQEEEKRRRAVKAYENRKKKKDYMSSLQTQILSFKQQIEELKQQKEVIQQRIDSLQSSSSTHENQ